MEIAAHDAAAKKDTMKYTEAHGLGGAPIAPAATEATLATIKPAIDLVKAAVDATTAAATGTTAAVDAQKIALLAAIAPLATEATLATIKPAIDGLKGAGNKTITDIVTALAPLATGATEATLAAVNVNLGTVIASLATNNADNTAIRASLVALQADSATMVGRVFNSFAMQRVAAGGTVNIPAGGWKSVSLLFATPDGSAIAGASIDGVNIGGQYASYEHSRNATTAATALIAIVCGNADCIITRNF